MAVISLKVGEPKYINVTVNSFPPTGITLSQENLLVKVGTEKTLLVNLEPSGASAEITWKSFDKTIADVDSKGKVLGVSEGTTLITATTDNQLSASCIVTVVKEFQHYRGEVLSSEYHEDPDALILIATYYKDNGMEEKRNSCLETALKANKKFVEGAVTYCAPVRNQKQLVLLLHGEAAANEEAIRLAKQMHYPDDSLKILRLYNKN